MSVVGPESIWTDGALFSCGEAVVAEVSEASRECTWPCRAASANTGVPPRFDAFSAALVSLLDGVDDDCRKNAPMPMTAAPKAALRAAT
ncbi:hypothetical protein [Streptomyces sp. NPDC059398]|uniref:hypothetical protein n=1 Tax=Streptomyces sp. NPDC059398 TaxID=3346820 RepID=UPI0036C7029F